MGDLTYTIYELAGPSPYPSLADGFYLAFYPLVLAGLLALPMASTVGLGERVRLWIDLAVVSLGGSAVVCYVVLGPTALADNGNLLQSVFTVAYPVGDVVLLVGLSALLLRGRSLTTRRPLMIFSVALSMFLVADLIYGYQVLHSGYVDGSPVDALWLAAIACFAVAGSTQRPLREKEGVVRTRARTSWGRALGLLVIGEGVETETQLAYLRALGCEAVQGYLLGRPQPAAESVQSRNAA